MFTVLCRHAHSDVIGKSNIHVNIEMYDCPSNIKWGKHNFKHFH